MRIVRIIKMGARNARRGCRRLRRHRVALKDVLCVQCV